MSERQSLFQARLQCDGPRDCAGTERGCIRCGFAKCGTRECPCEGGVGCPSWPPLLEDVARQVVREATWVITCSGSDEYRDDLMRSIQRLEGALEQLPTIAALTRRFERAKRMVPDPLCGVCGKPDPSQAIADQRAALEPRKTREGYALINQPDALAQYGDFDLPDVLPGDLVRVTLIAGAVPDVTAGFYCECLHDVDVEPLHVADVGLAGEPNKGGLAEACADLVRDLVEPFFGLVVACGRQFDRQVQRGRVARKGLFGHALTVQPAVPIVKEIA